MPPEAPAAPPPAPPGTPQAATPDPWMARILDDMGKAMSDGNLVDAPPKAPDPDRNILEGEFVSMGEHARFKKEKADAKAAEKPADPNAPPPAAPEKKDDKPATPPAAVDPNAPPPPIPPKKKVEVEKAKPLEEIVEGVVRRVAKEQVPPPTPAPKKEEPKADDPDAAFVEALDEEQKEAVELAQYAARSMPDKYGNMPKRTVEYLKKVDGYIDTKRKEDPDWDPDTDEGFATFIEENRPSYQSGDRKKLERGMIVDETRTQIEREFKPKIEESERIARVQQIKPELDKAVESYEASIAQRFIPDEKSPFFQVFKAASDKDPAFTEEAWKAAKEADPLAASVARNFVNQAKTLGREYLEIVSGVSTQVEYNPKAPPTASQNQKALTQQRLFGFIETQEQIFARDGGDMRTVNGKTFVTRRELQSMPDAQRAKHWTLSDVDVLDMLAVAAAGQANQTLQAELKRREDEGYVRNGKHSETKTTDAPPPPSAKREDSPRTTVTPSPGAANLPPPPSSPTVFTQADLDKQWSGGHSSWLG